MERGAIIESVDLFPTLCQLADVPAPAGMDGRSIVPEAEGPGKGKAEAICEWDFPAPQRRVNAIRTRRHRLVFYSHEQGGELYDHETDPYEMTNRYSDPAYLSIRLELLERLYDQVNRYARKTDFDRDRAVEQQNRFTPTHLIHKRCKKWSQIEHLKG
jgi:iduronate 2-sulfatase